jgi:hypothetical protein
MSSQIELDTVRIEVVTGMRHEELVARNQAPNVAEPTEVAVLAANLTRKFYHGDVVADSSHVLIAEWAGRMVYAMQHYGCNYEDVCDVAEHAIAQVVSGISPDLRLPPGPRHLNLKSRLGQADIVAQIVKLAEITCVARRILSSCTATDMAQHAMLLRSWADEALDLMSVFHRLEANKRIVVVLAAAKKMVGEIAQRAEAARKPARAVVKATPLA